MNGHVPYGYAPPYSSAHGGDQRRDRVTDPSYYQQAPGPTPPPQYGAGPVGPTAPQHAPVQHPGGQNQQQRGGQQAQAPPPAGVPDHPPGPARMDAPGASGPAQFDQGIPQGGPPGPASPVAAPGPAPPGEGVEPTEAAATPLVDVVETPDELLIVADVPGFEEEQISLQADDSTLLLVATREDTDDDERRIISAERPRRFERVVQLPPNGDVDAASATYAAGVCTVTIPKDGTDRREIGFH